MGEYPASFAVAMGDMAIVRYLAANGANLMCDRDSLGNYAVRRTGPGGPGGPAPGSCPFLFLDRW